MHRGMRTQIAPGVVVLTEGISPAAVKRRFGGEEYIEYPTVNSNQDYESVFCLWKSWLGAVRGCKGASLTEHYGASEAR
jgi:hypothetical protein